MHHLATALALVARIGASDAGNEAATDKAPADEEGQAQRGGCPHVRYS